MTRRAGWCYTGGVERTLFLAALAVAGCSSAPKPDPKSMEPYERYLGALELSRSGDPVDERELVRLLDDPDPLARDGAVVALGRLAKPEHVPLLIDALFEKVEEEFACRTHPEIVGKVPGACRICGAELQRREATRNTTLVRADACRALAGLRDPRAARPMLSVLSGDTSLEVRRVAALALEAFADQRPVLEGLVEAVGDPHVPVAHNAWLTLRKLSGVDLPRNADAWRSWLRQRG